MKKIILVLTQFILITSCFSAELEKAIYDYNNNKDGFKNQEIANLEKKIVKRTNQGEYLLFYDKDNNLIKIEEESESGDVLIYLRQYYKGEDVIYFEYMIDAIPAPGTNFVAKGYVKNKKIDKYKIYGNKEMGKWNIDKIKVELNYPSKSHLEYIKKIGNK